MMPERYKFLIATLLVTTFLGYSLYVYSAVGTGRPQVDEVADQGKMIWQQLNCTACHQVYGLGGFLGPDLTNIYSRKGPDHIRAFLKTGTNTMPAYPLSEGEIRALTAYLCHIDSNGPADPKSFTIHFDGTITQE